MAKQYEDVTISGSKRAGYTVTWYEWVEGQGRDCGLNRERGGFADRTEAAEFAAELSESNTETEATA